jgi:hypothetical protein
MGASGIFSLQNWVSRLYKSTIGAIAISISMFEAFLPSDDDH